MGAPRKQARAAVTISVPARARPGTYVLVVRAVSGGDASTEDRTAFEVTVTRR